MRTNKRVKKLSFAQLMKFQFKTGNISVNISHNSIIRSGETYVLQPKVLELLVLLCEAQGETLTKQQLIEALWPDTIVGPDSLANSMTRLRKALGDDVKKPTFIQTVQRKGYRWLPPVILSTPSPSWLQKSSLKSRYTALISFVIFLSIVIFSPSFIDKDEPEEFFFPDLSIKKLADGGYEIQAGIEGKLTEEKKAAMLKEIKRITGEENSGMEFTVGPRVSDCQYHKKNTENAIECDDKVK